ncbi:hypothetical protein GCM10023191_102330 [Actinoallomurus oryzae]|uniref:Uncharacterized protein n=1 Tax=Actinoallomurus oryzae TaxID=502180 RepID=A0ABP8R9P2_9ACTN
MRSTNHSWHEAGTAGPEADAYAKQADDLIADALGSELEGADLSPQTRILAGAAYALLSVGKRLEATEAGLTEAVRELTATVASAPLADVAGDLSDISLGIANVDDTLGSVATAIEGLTEQRRPSFTRLLFWRRRTADVTCTYWPTDVIAFTGAPGGER